MSQPNDFKKENNNKNTENTENKENKDGKNLPKNRPAPKPTKPIPSSLIPPYGTDPFEKPKSLPRPKHPFDTSFDTNSNLFKKNVQKKAQHQKLKKLKDQRAIPRDVKKNK